MKKILIPIILLIISKNVFSTPANIDVYGVDEQTSNLILNSTNKQVELYVDMEAKLNSTSPKELDNLLVKYIELKNRIIKKIKHYGEFKFVDISTVYYPDKNTKYTTIEIVTSAQAFRIPYSSTSLKFQNPLKLSKPAETVFKLWASYHESNISLMNQGKLNSDKKVCPVAHCSWGFNKEELRKYLPKFQKFANSNRTELEKIIHNSPNEEQRGDAIFILANSDDYQSTGKFLLNYINDRSSLVRNNSLRVIDAILSKHKIENFPLRKVLPILNYHLVTDRNKAANVILNIARQDVNTHKQILTASGDTLIKLLALKQPNNHNPAYEILKTISKENHSDTDIEFWRQWLKNHSQSS